MSAPTSDARPEAFPEGDARWARNDPASRMPNGLRLAVYHGESGTLFAVMRLEGEYWEVVGTRRTRHEAERLAWETPA